MIHVHDSKFEVFIDSNEIQSIVKNLADRINHDYKDRDPLLVGVLNGSFMFIADFVRGLDFDSQVSFVKLASYNGTSSSGSVNQLIGLNEDVKGRDILIIEDIVDSGNTLEKIINVFEGKEVRSIEIVALLFKSSVYQKNFKVKYYGADIPNKFVIGYGLDYDGRGRGYSDIYQIIGDENE